jgi:GNAT superfamily N-acetyltransferase
VTADADVYREAPRSYWSLLGVVGVFVIGFVIDAILGGATAHLIGWVAATAIVVGIWALVLYAVRSEKSLRVTAADLWVGDEAIPRDRIAGFAATADGDDDLPVLGWPRGKPRQLRGVTVRLADGRDVVVPTRFPGRLRTALGLGDEALPAQGQEVRAAARSELGLLAEVDDRAEAIFRAAGYHLPDIPSDPAVLSRAKAVFVAGRPPVAFVQLDEVDGLAHVSELAVIPRWMGQGIGTALLDRACAWAADKGYRAITLTTYADVPWNAPFYAKRGFVEIDELGPGLTAIRTRERELGLDDVGRRVVMRRDLG